MKRFYTGFIVPVTLALPLMWGCGSLRESQTSWPIKEYEKMIAGRLDADYVGTDSCVEKCHAHEKLANDFRLSVHGAQTVSGSGLPLVNCESCHGPGSLAVENIQNETCDFKTFIPIEEIAPGAQSLVCMKCHSSFSLANLSSWTGSRHAIADVSCYACHKIHKGPSQKVKRSAIADLCFECHREQKALFSLPSHHPVPEGKITCTDCHDVHGSAQDHNLRMTMRELCTRCHADKRGPFVVEHGTNLTDDCTRCHNPHGSINAALTTFAEPFVCLQCHNGHNAPRRQIISRGGPEARQAYFGKCSQCHPRHHGSDSPGFRIDGRFIR